MSRPRHGRAIAADDLRAEIESERTQLALLSADLRDALVAGENTAPYRQAIGALGKTISALEQKLAAAEAAAIARRQAIREVTATEIVAESASRHAAIVAAFAPPPCPEIMKEFRP